MSTDLLSGETLRNLALSKSLAEFRQETLETPYRELVQGMPNEAEASDYEKLFYTLFMERLEHVIHIAPSEASQFLVAYFLIRFEILNLKRILRGKYSRQSTDEIALTMLPLAPLYLPSIGRLLEANDVEDVVRQLEPTAYGSLVDRLEDFKRFQALWPLELELDRIDMQRVQESVGGVSSHFRKLLISLVEMETDVERLLLAFSLGSSIYKFEEPIDIGALFGRSRHIPFEVLDLSEGKDIGRIIGSLSNPYHQIFLPMVQGNVAMVRTNMRKYTLEITAGAAKQRPYEFTYVFWFLTRCEAESSDLTRISWALEQGLTFDRFGNSLVTVG